MSEQNTKVYACEEVRGVIRLHHDLFTYEFRQLPIQERLDRQAQRILEAHKAGDKAVVTHIQCWHPELVGHSVEEIMACGFTRDDARNTIAREYGFAGWPDVEQQGTDSADPDFEAAVDAVVNGDVDALQVLLEREPSLVGSLITCRWKIPSCESSLVIGFRTYSNNWE